jgi:predicted enzyme related to lactoylglutathione lyase
MINAVHALLHVQDADKARAFFKDVLGWSHVDAGAGRLIFAMPPAEIHPTVDDGDDGTVSLYLACDDLAKTLAALKKKGVKVVDAPQDEGYGIVAAIEVPGGGKMGIYQPRHPVTWKAALRKKTKKVAAPRGGRKPPRRD